MIITYDPLLVGLSIVIAIVGAYAGLRLARRIARKSGSVRKALLSGAAVAIGSGIWSMHFVGMLAISLPVTINYDVLLTLVSALLAILMTGLGLFIASYGALTARKLAFAGVLMGLGISTMHYVGMAAVRANCVIDYNFGLVGGSVLIGILASTLALWLAFNPRGNWLTLPAATVMGLAISGMHYTAMAAAAFLPTETIVAHAAPALDPHLLAIVVAVAAFLIIGATTLMALPDMPPAEDKPATPDAAQSAASASGRIEQAPHDPASGYLAKLPVQQNKATLFLDLDTIVSIQADAHYTRVHDGSGSYFCSYSLSELEARLDPVRFLRVHRSYIVNLDHARAFERHKEQGLIRLDGAAAPSVPVSRRNVPKLRMALGLQS
ncbi:MAG: LytTR family transcriptional regulator DNA-binding domain-containing protein [Alphaproteobacteria bacterium]|nr:LytTR family transcriptional regulator DNA-binding domain-containing protein [Alphaproteobacteria bacterium]